MVGRWGANAGGSPWQAEPQARPPVAVQSGARLTPAAVSAPSFWPPPWQYTPEQVHALRALADEYHLIPTGGSDFHGPGIHPTPLGGRHVPYEAVERLKAEAAKRRLATPPAFELPPPVQEK